MLRKFQGLRLVILMSAEPLIRELFRALEATIHERLSLVENILNTIEKPKVPLYDHEFIRRIERLEQQMNLFLTANHPTPTVNETPFEREMLEERIVALEEQLAATCAQVENLSAIQPAQTSASAPTLVEPAPSIILAREEDVAEPLDAVEEDGVEEVVEEEGEGEEEEEDEEEDEGESLQVNEFPYKGRMFYKDASENIYGTDGEGEIVPEPIGKWNGKKIVWT